MHTQSWPADDFILRLCFYSRADELMGFLSSFVLLPQKAHGSQLKTIVQPAAKSVERSRGIKRGKHEKRIGLSFVFMLCGRG